MLTLKVGNMMKSFFAFILVLPFHALALELKVGDVLLQPRHCWSCNLIEAQEETIYSHIGMVLEVKPKLKVVDALGRVKIQTMEAFDAGTQKDQTIRVRRFKDQNLVNFLQDKGLDFSAYYKKNFDGLTYDDQFLWDNVDENGNEFIYCSELVAKLLTGFLQIELPVKRMKFDKNRESWIRFFKGNPPDGEWGNSPADFEHSNLFYDIGEL